MPPHSLICCLVLSWLSSEKEGSGGQPKRPPEENNMAHRVHLETPHTAPHRTHKAHQMMHKESRGWWWVGWGRGSGRGSGIDYY